MTFDHPQFAPGCAGDDAADTPAPPAFTPVVEQAKGIMMATTGRPQAEAYTFLWQLSRRCNLLVRDLAAWLVTSTVHGSPNPLGQDGRGQPALAAVDALPASMNNRPSGTQSGMTTGARGHVGHFHEAGFFSSDEEFAALIVPFVEEGLAAGEPVILGYDDRKTALLRSWLADPAAAEFITGASLYATPGRAIAAYQRLFEHHTAMGARQIRIAGDVPHPGNGSRFEGWDRYEWALNTVWPDFPVWARCLYDTTTTPPDVLDVVERTHPSLVAPSGEGGASGRYQAGRAFTPLPPAPDLLQATAPQAQLIDRPAAATRRALTHIGRGLIPEAALTDLIIGAAEAVSNALVHGQPPATVRIWAAPGRVVVSVHDSGPGPADPLAGLIPATPARQHLGMGLWVMHQLDIDTALIHGPDGFTVRLRAGTIPS